ncbi:MAG: hypothetical protein ACKV2O_24130 [Acidimicrobiales bacterium]
MAKRKITVTVDEELIESIRQFDAGSLSSVVNAALGVEVERRAREAALARQLAQWDKEYGPVSATSSRWAEQVFDDLDGVNTTAEASSGTGAGPAPPSGSRPARTRRKGAA